MRYFLKDGDDTVDDNAVEQAIRGFYIGEKIRSCQQPLPEQRPTSLYIP